MNKQKMSSENSRNNSRKYNSVKWKMMYCKNCLNKSHEFEETLRNHMLSRLENKPFKV